MNEMKIVYKNIADLKMYKNNPRKNKEAIPYVKESIVNFGFKVPCVIDKNNEVVCGHTRILAAKELEMETVPCIVADDLTDEQIKAFRLADNKVSEFAEWDFNILNAELEEIFNFDMVSFGFEIEDITDDFGTDFELPDDDKPQTRTITLSLAEEQYQIAMNCIDYITENNLIVHHFNNANKKSNALFEVVYLWAEQKTLL